MAERHLPLYAQLKENIITAIDTGEFRPGDQLPSTRDLINRYKMSHMTVRRAITELVNEGTLYAVPGKGVYVTETKQNAEAGPFISFTEDMAQRNLKASSRVLDAGLIHASTVMARTLSMPYGAELVYLRRLRLANDAPMAIQSAYLNHTLCPGLLDYDWETESLYAILREKYRLDLTSSTTNIEAGLADETRADLLQVTLPAALLITEQLTCITKGQPIEFVRSVYRGDRYQVKFDQR